MPSLFLLLPIISTLLILFLGLFVFLSNPKDRINKNFVFLTLFSAIWILANLVVDSSESLRTALIFSKIAIVPAAFLAPIVLYFSLIFPLQKKQVKFSKIFLIFLPIFLFLILSPTRFNVEKVWLSGENGRVDFQPGILYFFLLFYFAIYFGLAFLNFFKSLKKAVGVERLQVVYLFVGFISALFIGLTTNILLPLLGYSQLVGIGPSFSLLIFAGFISLSVLKHHLFDIKVIATEILTAALVLTLLINVLVSMSTVRFLVNAAIFIVVLFFGILLIRAVLQEVRMRGELKVAYDELKKLDDAKSQFISMASHQLRTPLGAVRGYVSMMVEGDFGKFEKKQAEVLKNVNIATERLNGVVRDLMDISKIDLGKMEINKAPADIVALISSVCEEMKPRTKEKNLELVFLKPKSKLPQLNIDSFKIHQVISNILDNAIHYTERGGIEITLSQKPASIIIAIKDTGDGLTQEEQKDIFKGFVRGSAGINKFIEGTGLGLYVAKRYLDLHDGKIWAESEGKGKGSTFFVELPLAVELRSL